MTVPPPHRYRESTYESAETAEDIFDLYGAPPRDSWASGSGVGVALGDPDSDGLQPYPNQRVSYPLGPAIPPSPKRTNGNGYRLSQLPTRSPGMNGTEMEELEDEANTPMTAQSWDGPMATLSKRISGISMDSDHGPRQDFGRMKDEGQGLGIGGFPTTSGRRESLGSREINLNDDDHTNIHGQEYMDYPTASSSSTTTSKRKPLPTVTITPDMTPSKRNPSASVAAGTGEESRRVSTLSTSTSDSPSINRLTPRLSGYGDGNTSQASFGSSQYPGEDPDAFHVRSTCTFPYPTTLTYRCKIRI